MDLRENFTGFLLDPAEPLQTPHGQRGDLLDLNMNELTVGARGFSRTTFSALDQKQQVEVGYFARGDLTDGLQQRIEAATGHPYRTDADLESKLTNIGMYADLNLRFLKWLSLRGGVRADFFTFDVNNLCAVQSVAHPSAPSDSNCLDQENMGAYREPNQRATSAALVFQPRASVFVGPISGFIWSLSYGQGIRSIDPLYITDNAATPFAHVQSVDGGATYSRSIGEVSVVVRSIFSTHVDQDLIFSETAGRNILGGGTTRTGWLGAVRASTDWFDESASITLVKATFDDTADLVPYVPQSVFRSDTALSHTFSISGEAIKASVGLGVSFIGARPLPYGQWSDTVFLVDASMHARWRGVELALAASNLLDTRYKLGEFNYASDFTLNLRQHWCPCARSPLVLLAS